MRNAKGKIGAAVVGLGVGEKHAEAYAAHPACQLRRVFDLDMEKARTVAARLKTQVADSFTQICNDPDIQVISIASFDDAHFGQVMEGLNAGKHLFVEKPLCQTQEELAAIENRWKQLGGKLHVGSNLILRSAPLYRFLREEIRAGRMGELYSIDGDYLYGRLHKITKGWRAKVENYSVMEGGGVHLIDLMVWLCGQKPQSVFTLGNRLCSRETPFRYDDFMASTFQFPSGLIGRITSNYGCVHRHQHVLRLFGTEKTFVYDDAGPRFHLQRDPGREPEFLKLDTLPSHKGNLIPAFLEGILQESDPAEDFREMLDVIRICAAADLSLKTKTLLEIAYS